MSCFCWRSVYFLQVSESVFSSHFTTFYKFRYKLDRLGFNLQLLQVPVKCKLPNQKFDLQDFIDLFEIWPPLISVNLIS